MKLIQKTIVLFMAVLILLLGGCSAADTDIASGRESIPETTVPISEAERHKVIIDTDTGSDDAAALILAATSDRLDILGITVLYGNVPLDDAAKNALMTLEVCGVKAPVYIGANKPLTKEREEMISVHGADGMGDQDLIHPKSTAEDGDAVDFILDTVKSDPGEVEIIALGPLTNIALAVQKDPDTMKLCKRIWVMGTTGFGTGNATPVSEFNVYSDAEAYDVVLREELPMTVIGLDMVDVEEAKLTPDDLSEMAQGNEKGVFMSKAFTKLFVFYQSSGKNMMLPDPMAVACLIWQDMALETKSCYGVACTGNDAAYGQIILYQEGAVYEAMPQIASYNLEVVTKIDAKFFKDSFMSVMTS
ncbi:MAG: nucleoside hydrolase [Ruminococcus sp.]|nr:nucleoside hydrolase [Ruminococcus sp.]